MQKCQIIDYGIEKRLGSEHTSRLEKHPFVFDGSDEQRDFTELSALVQLLGLLC